MLERGADPGRPVSSNQIHALVRPGSKADSLRPWRAALRAGGAVLRCLSTEPADGLPGQPPPAFCACECEGDDEGMAGDGMHPRYQRGTRPTRDPLVFTS